jgi:hypothetical protein
MLLTCHGASPRCNSWSLSAVFGSKEARRNFPKGRRSYPSSEKLLLEPKDPAYRCDCPSESEESQRLLVPPSDKEYGRQSYHDNYQDHDYSQPVTPLKIEKTA